MNANQIIMDDIRDHFIPHIFEKKITKEILNALISLYDSENIDIKMILQNKLRSIKMKK